MNFCTQCGKVLRPEAKFCGYCGTKVRVAPDAVPLEAAKDAETIDTIEKAAEAEGIIEDAPDEPFDEVSMEEEPAEAPAVVHGVLPLTSGEMEYGCSKVIEFGTGKIYRVDLPGRLAEGTVVIVKGTNARSAETDAECDLVLTIERAGNE